MLFDVQAALAEILAAPLATPATSATQPPGTATMSQMSRVSRSQPCEILAPANVLPFAAPPGTPEPSRPGEAFPHGRDRDGWPRTWTGRVVSLDAWRNLSEWDRHGPAGMLFCGICRSWKDREIALSCLDGHPCEGAKA